MLGVCLHIFLQKELTMDTSVDKLKVIKRDQWMPFEIHNPLMLHMLRAFPSLYDYHVNMCGPMLPV